MHVPTGAGHLVQHCDTEEVSGVAWGGGKMGWHGEEVRWVAWGGGKMGGVGRR